jgi:putative endonuclease
MQIDWYFYLVRCRDGSLYAGSTNDLKRRVDQHNAGRGGRYTSSHRPVELAYAERYLTRNEAMRREASVKALRRQQKETLIYGGGFIPLGMTGVWTANDERSGPAVSFPRTTRPQCSQRAADSERFRQRF